MPDSTQKQALTANTSAAVASNNANPGKYAESEYATFKAYDDTHRPTCPDCRPDNPPPPPAPNLLG